LKNIWCALYRTESNVPLSDEKAKDSLFLVRLAMMICVVIGFLAARGGLSQFN
jgi:hypothetical protein